MIESFTKAWFANLDVMRQKFTEKHPTNYKEVVQLVISMLASSINDDEVPDPNRIHQINEGDYQGTLVYVISEQGYQPRTYWYVQVSYGSCSGCDTLKGIRYSIEDENEDEDQKPNSSQVDQYMTLALHILQKLRRME